MLLAAKLLESKQACMHELRLRSFTLERRDSRLSRKHILFRLAYLSFLDIFNTQDTKRDVNTAAEEKKKKRKNKKKKLLPRVPCNE